jgi:NCS2 family nucleobase:cation symporter-2
MATLSALTLNLLFNILGGKERAAINDCHAH